MTHWPTAPLALRTAQMRRDARSYRAFRVVRSGRRKALVSLLSNLLLTIYVCIIVCMYTPYSLLLYIHYILLTVLLENEIHTTQYTHTHTLFPSPSLCAYASVTRCLLSFSFVHILLIARFSLFFSSLFTSCLLLFSPHSFTFNHACARKFPCQLIVLGIALNPPFDFTAAAVSDLRTARSSSFCRNLHTECKFARFCRFLLGINYVIAVN